MSALGAEDTHGILIEMSKRLQVLMSEEEYSRLKAYAKLKRMPVGEWVRRVVGRALDDESVKPAEQKLKALQAGLSCSHPAPDIQQMNREIEEGYLRDLH